ncbi:hypothetical protein UFOVP536_19 [uncultured Caudovirales phage]|uniref:Uncharacterized protein n=1 Tax=uncultured Caudovirales phage TaxID=2100421 RepID=A0A6J5MUF5_9CAUD|nr:hypothetical protein UFOVP536_19 [uncultured Caudovirales phage]
MTKLRAAVENNIRPCAMFFHEQPSDPWTKFDFMLLEAYQILKDETCNDCGNPIWICHNEFANNVGFKVKSTVCYAKAELEKHNERVAKNSSTKQRYGETDYTVAYTYDDSPMPSRMSYLKAMSEQYSGN